MFKKIAVIAVFALPLCSLAAEETPRYDTAKSKTSQAPVNAKLAKPAPVKVEHGRTSGKQQHQVKSTCEDKVNKTSGITSASQRKKALFDCMKAS